ncbi:hypothetical protein D3C76_1263900 [compost metagenome]
MASQCADFWREPGAPVGEHQQLGLQRRQLLGQSRRVRIAAFDQRDTGGSSQVGHRGGPEIVGGVAAGRVADHQRHVMAVGEQGLEGLGPPALKTEENDAHPFARPWFFRGGLDTRPVK